MWFKNWWNRLVCNIQICVLRLQTNCCTLHKVRMTCHTVAFKVDIHFCTWSGLYLPIKLQSTSDQLQAIIKNNKLLYELDVFPTVYAAFRATSYAFETISKQQVITTETQLTLDLNILEATTYLSIMYSIVLINMRDPAFINEICMFFGCVMKCMVSVLMFCD